MALVQEKWRCLLSVTPKRVRDDDVVKMKVTVLYGNYELLVDNSHDEYRKFNFQYDSRVDQLDTYLKNTDNHINHAPDESFTLTKVPDGDCEIGVTATPKSGGTGSATVVVSPGNTKDVQLPSGSIKRAHDSFSVITNLIETDSKVTLQRTFAAPTDDRALWTAIRNRTAAVGFDRYKAFIDCVFCPPNAALDPLTAIRTQIVPLVDHCLDDSNQELSIYGPYAYGVLKLATQAFLTLESGVVIRDTDRKPKIFDLKKEQIRLNDFSPDLLDKLNKQLRVYLGNGEQHLPYLDRIVKNLITFDPQDIDVLPYCLGVLQFRLTSPSLIELIWSYWLEEGMLVQTMNAIARRFQNRRGPPNDPLGELEFDPLRPLNNLIWGFIQDEYTRLTVPRRAHEYLHHYGLSLMGKAVPDLAPADSRSKFIEAFHNLLSAAARFFKEDSDTTVMADAFPLLNALKEVHLILAEGAHNQFGDLTWTARAEMLTIQWMLARPEMKEFLRGRYMVPYQEEWMGAVDSMKKLQGWTDTTITHFYELAVMGERLLLSVRYGDWSDIENIEDQAKNWARSNKPEIQIYIHGYRTVTGVDLAAEVTDSRDAATRYLQPSALLQRRLAEQMSAIRLPPSSGPNLVAARVSGQAALPRPGRPKLPAYRKGS
jgi:hypothetical protein